MQKIQHLMLGFSWALFLHTLNAVGKPTDQRADVEVERRVVVGFGVVEVDEEEDVGPHVVFLPHVVTEALRDKRKGISVPVRA